MGAKGSQEPNASPCHEADEIIPHFQVLFL
jgi:hypothetical protein